MSGLKVKRIVWTVVFLGVTLVAIVMEVLAGVFHVAGTIPWTEYIAEYVPWPVQLAAYVILAVWLPFHFYRHDHMRNAAYSAGRGDAVAQHAAARAMARPDRGDIAIELVKYALHLRMHGERAPGGDETWETFDRRAEQFLRDGG